MYMDDEKENLRMKTAGFVGASAKEREYTALAEIFQMYSGAQSGAASRRTVIGAHAREVELEKLREIDNLYQQRRNDR